LIKARYTLPCPRAVNTGARVLKNDTRVRWQCWSPAYPTRPVNTGVIFLTPVCMGRDMARGHAVPSFKR